MTLRKKIQGVGTGALLMALTAGAALAQGTKNPVIDIYPGVAPGSEDAKQQESFFEASDAAIPGGKDIVIINVTKPTLTVFKPAKGKANGAAVVVAPGGGFRVLSWTNEGLGIAQKLADHGYTAFIIKYRLEPMQGGPDAVLAGASSMAAGARGAAPPAGGAPAAPRPRPDPNAVPDPKSAAALGVKDGIAAVRLIRSRAAEFGVDPKRVGIMGFSAGGSVASGTTLDLPSGERPAWVGIIYSGARGEIPKDAPPAFMAAAADDGVAKGMPDLFNRWTAAGAQAELHIWSKGKHGFGSKVQKLPVDNWMDDYFAWLEQQGFTKPAN